MKHYVGIDLGTTNSAICSFDGTDVRIWKSPDQNDVTPSAILIDRRGNKLVGKRAYDSAPNNPDNAAMLFKRLMGTSTPITLAGPKITLTPEECSAEILKVLCGYLPEEIRQDAGTGTVITVPAAFNQMQKDATMHAAQMAGIGKVALMQEPVAAVMSVMRARNSDGMFLIYDFGGGTLDIAIAESIDGHVSLLSHGGIAMCGGRDFDRALVETIVAPWLASEFSLPTDFLVNPLHRSLIRLAAWAAERAKIELSSRDDAVISLSESEVRMRDAEGREIYFDIPLSRTAFDALINGQIEDSVRTAKEALSKAGVTPQDLERIVFVGGPTNYRPLRDKVASELGIPGSMELNPMTAVAEGASLFAESIDWSQQSRTRKTSRGQLSAGGALAISFNYAARTPGAKAKIALHVQGNVVSGAEVQIDSIDTGWTSGRISLAHGSVVEVSLAKPGENTFKVFVFDSKGGPVALEQDKIIITRTAATVDAIPASHSVGIEVLEKLGGRPVLDYLVRAGDSLPCHGKRTFKAAESLKAGSSAALNFKLWEGEIEDPLTDNRQIGCLKISGSDIEDGVIPAGATLECDYEIRDSGNIVIEVSVPSIGGVFHSGKNFYSRQEGQLDYTSAAALVLEEGSHTLDRIDGISEVVDDDRLDLARDKINSAVSLDSNEIETEKTQDAMEKVLEARKLLAQVKKDHLKEIRQIDLDGVVSFFNEHVRKHARPSEATAFDNLVKTAQRSIDRNDKEFEVHYDDLRGKNFEILWRQDWFVIDRFKSLLASPHLFVEKAAFEQLKDEGTQAMKADDIEKLRGIVGVLSRLKMGGNTEDEMLDTTNIVKA